MGLPATTSLHTEEEHQPTLREAIARIRALRTERDELAAENADLRFFQQMASAISSKRDVDKIIHMLLRYVCELLKFDHAIYFEVADEDTIYARAERHPDMTVEVFPISPAYAAGERLLLVAQGRADHITGKIQPRENATPPGVYCVVPMVARDRVRGLLYAESTRLKATPDRLINLLSFFAGQAAIAIENARLYQQTQDLALRDPLTELPNRRALSEQCEHALHAAERNKKRLAYVMIDLDNFKTINDTQGHPGGDKALMTFANCLRAAARKDDIIARFAGDEFIVVMTNESVDEVRLGVERIQARIAETGMTCSIGVAIFPCDGDNERTLHESADVALYAAKKAGKNCYRMYAPPAW